MENTRKKLSAPPPLANILKDFETNPRISKNNKKLILDFIKHKQENDYPKPVDNTLIKIIRHLSTCAVWFKSDFNAITKEEFRRVKEDLCSDKLKYTTQAGQQAYSEESKRDYIQNLKQIARWIWAQGKNKSKDSFDAVFGRGYHKVEDKIEEPLILSLDVVDYLLNSAKSLNTKFTIALLFNSGARPEELWNCKKSDLVYDNKDKKYFIHIRFPKKHSSKRTVDLPLHNDIIKHYQASILTKGADELLININYHYFSRWLIDQSAELAKRGLIPAVHGKPKQQITVYSFRHSAIQYFGELYQWNYTFLANRFGWSYSTVGARLKDYIARSKVGLPDATMLARKDEFAQLNTDIQVMRERQKIAEQENQNLKNQMENMRKEMEQKAMQLINAAINQSLRPEEQIIRKHKTINLQS